jgi:regulator of sirC expression with transglutaminase-like and TPR domain
MNLDSALEQLARDPECPMDLAELALELARDEYAELDVEAYLSELAGMAHEARRYLRGDLEARVTGLCRYLFHEMGFRGNQEEYYDPRNSYFNQVLDRRTGIPITLSAVVMAVGARAGLAVAGVGLPGHFVAKAAEDGREVLFDPFHGGRLLTPESCEHLVAQVTGAPFHVTPEQLAAVPLGLIIQRMLANLKGVYLRQEDYPRLIRVIERLRQVNPRDLHQIRDLGVSWLQAGQPGRAIDYLTTYLDAVPQGEDAETVRKVLERARGEIARWN